MSFPLPASLPGRCFYAFLAGWVLLARPSTAVAEEIKVEAMLVWGTNEDKSKKPDHQPVDAKTAKKLKKIFTWKNYFQEKHVVTTIANRTTKKIELSSECTVEIRELEGAQVEVQLVGKGEPVSKATKPFTKGEWIVIGGDDRNECAWFVILKRL